MSRREGKGVSEEKERKGGEQAEEEGTVKVFFPHILQLSYSDSLFE